LNANGLGHQFAHQPKPLGFDLLDEKVGAGRIAAWPGEAGDQTELNRVFADEEDDRDGCGRSFGCQGCKIAAKRDDNSDTAADQIGRQLWKPIEATLLQPAIFDCHILTFDVAGLAETPAEGNHILRNRSGSPRSEHPHDRLARCCGRAVSGHAARPIP